MIVDLDVRQRPYGDWMRADLPRYDSVEVDEFFACEGFTSRAVETVWRFESRDDLEAVLRIEFSAKVAHRALAEVTGLSVPVGYRVLHRDKPTGLLTP